MSYLTELSDQELQRNFEMAHEHLKQVFSKYPYPIDMEGCPCCVSEDKKKSLSHGDLNVYLPKAMTTWGDDDDFKHYIPQLFAFVYLEEKSDETFIFVSKLNYVQNWSQEETQAIFSWFSAYSQYKYVRDLKELIEGSRLNVQDWLQGCLQELTCDFPFFVFFKDEFDEMIPFLYPDLLKKFADLLDRWPRDEIDFVAYASCLTRYLIFSDSQYGIFKEKVAMWIAKNENRIEELFWKTVDPRLQKLFSETLPPNFFPTSALPRV